MTKAAPSCSEVNLLGSSTAKIGIRMPSVVSALRNNITITSNKVRLSHFNHVLQIHTNKPHHILLPSFLLSLQDQDTLLENLLTVSPLYQKPQLSIVSYLEQLLCGMPYLLMFNKQAQSMLLRSFSNPILKYMPSTILLCFLFVLLFLIFFFSLFLFPFSSLLVMPHTSHLQERSPTSIGLLFLQSCLNICLWSLKSQTNEQTKDHKNGVCSLKWRLTDRYLRWGTLAHPRLSRAE